MNAERTSIRICPMRSASAGVADRSVSAMGIIGGGELRSDADSNDFRHALSEMDTIAEAGLATESRRLHEFLDEEASVRENHSLRCEVVDIGRDLHKRKTFPFRHGQQELQRPCCVAS